jgi:hypothetical protein
MAKQFQVDSGGTLLTSLLGYWKLDDVNDFYSTKNLTNNNSATFAAGKIGNGVSLAHASNQYLDTTDTLGVDGGNFSWAGWVKVGTAPSSGVVNAIFVQGNNTSKVGFWLSYFNNSGTLQLFADRGKFGVGDQTGTYNTTLTAGTWYHLVYTYDGSTILVYLNNSQVISFAASGSGSATGFAGFGIGRDSDTPTGRTWDGMIDEAAAWSKALSTTEISDLYNGGSGQTMVNVLGPEVGSVISQPTAHWFPQVISF